MCALRTEAEYEGDIFIRTVLQHVPLLPPFTDAMTGRCALSVRKREWLPSDRWIWLATLPTGEGR